jgi:lipocalin
VQNLDLNKFYGDYYEMYTDSYVQATFEENTYCSTVSFTETHDGSGNILFHSGNNIGAPNGTHEKMEGIMYLPDGASSAQYNLALSTSRLRTVPYWVLDVGPDDDHGNYEYVIMGGSTGLTMWVYARDIEEFMQLYHDDVYTKLQGMGYLSGDRTIEATYQDSDCAYERDEIYHENKETSEGAKAVLGVIIVLAIGVFVLAAFMFVKNRPRKSLTSGMDEEDEESVHLVPSQDNPLGNGVAKSTINVQEGIDDDKL